MGLVRFFDSHPKAVAIGAALVAMAVISFLDYATGPDPSFSIFYLVPIALVAWVVGKRAGFLFSVFGAASWLAVDLASVEQPVLVTAAWNATVRLGFFIIVTVLLADRKRLEEGLEEKIRIQTKDLVSEIEQRKQAEKEILQKNRDLQSLLYVSSHDLREPLRAIQAFSRLVTARYADRLDEKGKDFLGRIIRGGERMERLIDDILVLSRAQRLSRPDAKVNGEILVQAALKQLLGKIETSHASVRVIRPFPDLCVDKTWAVQAVANLLANALKFTRAGEAPDIEIGPYVAEPGATDGAGIVVRDRGPGVRPEQAERIFELFQRAVPREVEGTGAGLAIVRQIAERHGGRTWVRPHEGGGSEFIVTFGAGVPAERTER